MAEKIRNEIRTLVQKHTTLENILTIIENTHLEGRRLTLLEQTYVKYKFLKYGLQFWLEFVKNEIPNFNLEKLVKLMSKLEKVNCLEDIPKELRSSNYFKNILNSGLLQNSSDDVDEVLCQLRDTFWEGALNSCDALKWEMKFTEFLVQFLTQPELFSAKKRFINDLDLLQSRTGFLVNPIVDYFTELPVLEESESEIGGGIRLLSQLEECARYLTNLESTSSYFSKRVESIISLYVSKPKIEVGKGTLTLTGNDVVLSEVIPLIEDRMQQKVHSDEIISEVRIFSANLLYADRSISGDLWAHVNFVLSSEYLVIRSCSSDAGSIIWDFSGRNGNSAPQSTPPQPSTPSSNGIDGKDGEPGESGGNVMIYVRNKVSGPSNLEIISNGGSGGQGQPGGDASNGTNGLNGDERCSMSLSRFKDDLPSPTKWVGKSAGSAANKCTETLKTLADNDTSKMYIYSEDFHKYIRITTKAGAQAGFSCWDSMTGDITGVFSFVTALGGIVGSRQSYGWFFGAPGTEGTPGGIAGRGGRGGAPGYPGEIMLEIGATERQNMIESRHSSGRGVRDGQPGQNGRAGTTGNCGRDFAFVDPCVTIAYASSTLYYEGRLVKRTSSGSREDGSYCIHEKAYVYFSHASDERPALRTEFQHEEQKSRSPIRASQKQSSILQTAVKNAFDAILKNSEKSASKTSTDDATLSKSLSQLRAKTFNQINKQSNTISNEAKIIRDNCDTEGDKKKYRALKNRLKEYAKTQTEDNLSVKVSVSEKAFQFSKDFERELAMFLENNKKLEEAEFTKLLKDFPQLLACIKKAGILTNLSMKQDVKEVLKCVHETSKLLQDQKTSTPLLNGYMTHFQKEFLTIYRLYIANHISTRVLNNAPTPFKAVFIPQQVAEDPFEDIKDVDSEDGSEDGSEDYSEDDKGTDADGRIQRANHILQKLFPDEETATDDLELINTKLMTVLEIADAEGYFKAMYSKAKSYMKRMGTKNQSPEALLKLRNIFKRTILHGHSILSFENLTTQWEKWILNSSGFIKSLSQKVNKDREELISVLQKVVFDETPLSNLKNDEAQVAELYAKLNDKERFPMDDIILNSKTVQQFSNMIVRNGISFADLELFSAIGGMTVELYSFPDLDEGTFRLRQYFNGYGTLELLKRFVVGEPGGVLKLLEDTDGQLSILEPRMVIDRESMSITIHKIVSDLNKLDAWTELDEYAEKISKRSDAWTFGHSPRDSSTASVNFDQDSTKGEEIINLVTRLSQHFTKESLEAVNSTLTAISFMQPELLKSLDNRFLLEGRKIDTNLVTKICSICSKEDQLQDAQLLLMVQSVDQRFWKSELALLEICFSLSYSGDLQDIKDEIDPPVNEWRNLMAQLPNDSILDIFVTKIGEDKTFHLDKNAFCKQVTWLLEELKGLALSSEDMDELYYIGIGDWSYKLNQLKLRAKLAAAIGSTDPENLAKALYYLLSLQNEYGNFVEKVLSTLENFPTAKDTELLIKILSNFYQGVWLIPDNNCDTPHFKTVTEWNTYLESAQAKLGNKQKTDRTLDNIISLIKKDKNNTVAFETLKNVEQNVLKTQGSWFSSLKSVIMTDNSVTQWAEAIRLNNFKSIDFKPNFEEMLEKIDQGIKSKRGFRLRDTQKVAVFAAILNPQNILTQVSTGEGKSLIVVAWAIMKSLCGESCDIITSSSVLAIRDAEENADIYSLFGVNVGHNSSNDLEDRRKAYQSHVVYGDAGSFQRDYLLDKYYGKNVLGRRSDLSKVNVMIDEVDSMLLDKGNNVLYLSHQPGGLEALETLFIFIWQTVNYKLAAGEYPLAEEIAETIFQEMFTYISKDDCKHLDAEMGDKIFESLVASGQISKDGRIVMAKGSPCSVKLTECFKSFQNRLNYLVKKIHNRQRNLLIPKYLKPFVELHLITWIESALKAIQMQPDVEYVVDSTSKNYLSIDSSPKIIIVDRDTGVDMCQSQWNDGLHQFLQLKHQCKISPVSLKAIFISNVSYFRRYKRIHGLTGTLGSKVERDFLQNTYGVDFMNVPMALPKRFVEEVPMLTSSREEWRQQIVDKSLQLKQAKRSVLIICDTILNVDFIANGFDKTTRDIFIYKRSYEKFSITSKGSPELSPGKIIIATNLAGRGTDIKISKDLDSNGGLYIILSYLPDNIRVEQQAFGRAARNGQNGSGQLIIQDADSVDADGISNFANRQTEVVELKMERDEFEITKISEIKKQFEETIRQEKLFDPFSQSYSILKRKLGAEKELNFPKKMQEFLANCCLDEWAFWLDDIEPKLTEESQTPQKDIDESLSKLTLRLDRIKTQGSAFALAVSPAQIVSIGKFFLDKSFQNNNAKTATFYFDKVIQQESDFATSAWYYKASAYARQTLLETEDQRTHFQTLLLKAENGFSKMIDQEMTKVSTVRSISEQLVGTPTNTFIRADSFELQKNNTIDLLQRFIQSIRDILGPTLSPGSFKSLRIKDDGASAELVTFLCQSGLLRDISPSQIDFHADADYQSVAEEYAFQGHDLKSALGKMRKDETMGFESIIKALKMEINLPNKQQFWDSLLTAGVITDAKWLVILMDQETVLKDESFKQIRDHKQNGFSAIYQFNTEGMVFFRNVAQVPRDEKGCIVGFTTSQDPSRWNSASQLILRDLESRKMVQVNLIGVWKKDHDKRARAKFFHQDFKTLSKELANNGTPEEAKGVWDHLVKEGLLDKEGFLLHLNFQDINWGLYTIYKDDVIDVLNTQCIYRRICLEMDVELQDNPKDPLYIRVNEDPYTTLAYDMLSKGMLQEVTLNYGVLSSLDLKDSDSMLLEMLNKVGMLKDAKKVEDMQTDLRNRFINLNDFKLFFERKNFPAETTKELKKYLEKKEWLRDNYLYIPSNLSLAELESPWNNQIILEYLQMRAALCEKEERGLISRVLEQSQSKLHILRGKQIDGSLEALDDVLDQKTQFECFSELETLKLSSLDSLVTLGEAKWTWTVIFKTICCLILGLLQIAAGIALEIFTVGFGTFAGAVLISEGISDIFYSVQCAWNGTFSWGDYWQHKWKSLLFSCFTAGVGMYFSAGAKVSKYGVKLAGSTGALSKLSGMELIKEMGWKAVLKKARDSMGYKVLTGLANGATSVAVSKGVEALLSTFCTQLADNIRGQISTLMTQMGVTGLLLTLFNMSEGVLQTARKATDAVLDAVLSAEGFTNQLLGTISSIASSVMQGIGQGMAKSQSTGDPSAALAIILKTSELVLTVNSYWNKIADIISATKVLLSKLKVKLSTVVSGDKKSSNADANTMTESDEQFKTFERDVRHKWEEVIQSRVSDIIKHQILIPVCQGLATKAVTSLGRKIRKEYRAEVQARIGEQFEKLKASKPSVSGTEIEDNESSMGLKACREEQLQQYYQNVRHLQKKCTDPDIYAEMVKEGGPMDYVAVQAFCNRYNVTIRMTGLEGYEHPDCVCPMGADPATQPPKVIDIELKDNHFSSSADSSGEKFLDQECFYRAVSDQMDLKGVDAKEFRNEIANQIRSDPGVKNILKNQWHRVYLDKGGYGGWLKTQALRDKALEIKNRTGLAKSEDAFGIYGEYELLKDSCSKQGKFEADHFPPKCVFKVMTLKQLKDIYREQYPDLGESQFPKSREELLSKISERQTTILLPKEAHRQVTQMQRDLWPRMKELTQQGRYDEVLKLNQGIYESIYFNYKGTQSTLAELNKHGILQCIDDAKRYKLVDPVNHQRLYDNTNKTVGRNLDRNDLRNRFDTLKPNYKEQIRKDGLNAKK